MAGDLEQWFSALGHDLLILISKSTDIMIQIHNSNKNYRYKIAMEINLCLGDTTI